MLILKLIVTLLNIFIKQKIIIQYKLVIKIQKIKQNKAKKCLNKQ